MKSKILYLIFLFILFSLIVGGYFLYTSFTTRQGTIKVISSPVADVTINGKSYGKTPVESDLNVGSYDVKITPSGNPKDIIGWSGKVNINKNTITYINRELGSNVLTSSGVIFTQTDLEKKLNKKNVGNIEVTSDPDGSIVFLDNEERGITPLTLENIDAEEHELAVYSPGFFRRSQKITVDEGVKVIAQYKLSIDPTFKKVDKEQNIKELERDKKLAEENKKLTPTVTPTPAITQKAVLSQKVSPSVAPRTRAGDPLFSVTIDQTDTGWLRVRDAAASSGTEIGKANPGDSYDVFEETNGWYRISFEGKDGWISSTYASKE